MWVAVNTFKEEQFNAKGSFNWEENAIDQQMVILLPNVILQQWQHKALPSGFLMNQHLICKCGDIFPWLTAGH